MLTSLIRSRTILGFLLSYILAASILLTTWLLLGSTAVQNDLLFAHWAFSWLESSSAIIPLLCLSLAAVGVILSRIRLREVRNILGNTNLTMLAMVCVLTVQARPLFTRPDILIASLILVALFMLLLATYKREQALSEIFHTGLLLGVASLFVGQSILLLISVAFSLFILRTGNWREWAVFLLGVAMTAVFVMLFAIWSENPLLAFQRIVQTAWVGSFSTDRLSAGNIVLLVLVVFSVSSLFRDITIGTVNERNITLVNVSWIIGATLMVLVLGLGWQSGIILAAFPLSSFISKTIEQNTRWWIQDLMLILLLSAPILSILLPL